MRMSPELTENAGELFHYDHVVQRQYRYPAGWRIPVPVAAVGWTDDDVIVRTFVLCGAHGDFLRCPASLQDVVARFTSASHAEV